MKFESICKLARDEKGLSTVEYTILLVLIVAVSVGIWNRLGGQIADTLGSSTDQIETETEVKFRK